jgi:hypothetical protein
LLAPVPSLVWPARRAAPLPSPGLARASCCACAVAWFNPCVLPSSVPLAGFDFDFDFDFDLDLDFDFDLGFCFCFWWVVDWSGGDIDLGRTK